MQCEQVNKAFGIKMKINRLLHYFTTTTRHQCKKYPQVY